MKISYSIDLFLNFGHTRETSWARGNACAPKCQKSFIRSPTTLPKVPQKKSLQVGFGHIRRDEAERIMAESCSLPRWATSVARPPSGTLKLKKKGLSCNHAILYLELGILLQVYPFNS